jgi:hypothetical protein
MSARFFCFLLFPLLCLPHTAPVDAADFSFHRLEGAATGPTLLIIGGVDGDEPGGFHAAATLVTRYRIEQGQLWVVPNLSFDDILKRRRGTMNLKFASIDKHDRYFSEVRRIQAIISRPKVDLVLNLHDGSGFYHPTRVDAQRNPDRWGQCFVIDQRHIDASPFGALAQLIAVTRGKLNQQIPAKQRQFQLKNTRTHSLAATAPARQSLTYFATRKNKPALAIEASKSDPVHLRTYYHLLALETLMDAAGIGYQRDFPLTPAGVAQVIADDGRLELAEGRIQLRLSNMRPQLDYFPLPETQPAGFSAANPLITLQPVKQGYRIHYGNNRLAYLNPQPVELDRKLAQVSMVIDGIERQVDLGSVIPVANSFRINPPPAYRANVIGYTATDKDNDDSGLMVEQKQLLPRYSIDQKGQRYRVEIYQDEKFSGMVLVDFNRVEEKAEPWFAGPAQPEVGREHNN